MEFELEDNKFASEESICLLLGKKYPAPEWAFISQVRSATGAVYVRTADGLAMNLWPSRGLELIGFEVKTHRSDWLKELRDPSKSNEIQKYCNKWYIVTSSKAIIQPGELPTTWGWMAVEIDKLKVVTEAPKLEPKEIDKTFLAAILRRAYEESSPLQELESVKKEGYEKGYADGKKINDEALRSLQKRINGFEEKSGIGINDWNYERMGNAVHTLLGMNPTNLIYQLKNTKDQFARYVKTLETGVEELQEFHLTLGNKNLDGENDN